MITILLALAACDGGKVILDDTAGSGFDSDADTDADADTDTDTDTDTEVETTALTFVLGGETDADAIELDWLTEEFALYGTLAGASVDGNTVTVDVPTPSNDELIAVDGVPGLYIRYAMAFVYTDDNANLVHDDEYIRGVGTVLPIYVAGDIPIEVAALGLVEGWNALAITEGETPVPYDIDAIPLAINVTTSDSAALGGTLTALADASTNLALVPAASFSGGSVSALLYNQTLGDPWEITVAGEVPADHVIDIDSSGLYGSIEVPVSYEDLDGNGFPGADEIRYPACDGPDLAALLWLEPPTDLLVAWSFASSGIGSGWYAVSFASDTDSLTLLDEEAAAGLVIGGDCSFD